MLVPEPAWVLVPEPAWVLVPGPAWVLVPGSAWAPGLAQALDSATVQPGRNPAFQPEGEPGPQQAP